jgi:hypothetical protein
MWLVRQGAPQEVITTAWQRHVFPKDRSVDLHAYTFCVLDRLLTALHRRDVFAKPSWRYADPRAVPPVGLPLQPAVGGHRRQPLLSAANCVSATGRVRRINSGRWAWYLT